MSRSLDRNLLGNNKQVGLMMTLITDYKHIFE